MSVFSKVYEEQMSQIVNHEEYRTDITYHFIRQLFTSMVLSSFKYEPVPDFIKVVPDYIEECFYGSGTVAFTETDKTSDGYVIAPCYPNGRLLNNRLYSSYTLILPNGATIIKPIEDIELGFNNSLHTPSRLLLDEMIENCVRALRAVDMSLLKAQLPAVFALDDESKIATLVQTIDDNYKMRKPYSIVSGDWIEGELKRFEMYDNRATDILALWDVFVRYKNLLFTTYGINNVEITKTERLTLQESQSNTEITRYGQFYDMFSHRRDWVARIKEHFGYEMTVDINRNFDTVTEFEMDTEDKIEMQKDIITPYRNQMNGSNQQPEKEVDGND